jgi:hypothetical protein
VRLAQAISATIDEAQQASLDVCRYEPSQADSVCNHAQLIHDLTPHYPPPSVQLLAMHPVHARTAPFSEAINEALRIAATMNASDIVSVLMQPGANPLAILDDATGDTALHEAASSEAGARSCVPNIGT